VPKHFLLGMFFEKLNIPFKYATYLFPGMIRRSDNPPELRQAVKLLPLGTHLACRINLDGRWVLVDATWDFKLKKAGFPVNENWDGTSSTKNAVNPDKRDYS
jgi:hypothetical protein